MKLEKLRRELKPLGMIVRKNSGTGRYEVSNDGEGIFDLSTKELEQLTDIRQLLADKLRPEVWPYFG